MLLSMVGVLGAVIQLQAAAVKGSVRESASGQPLAEAVIRVRGSEVMARSNGEGRFTVAAATGEWVVVAHIGYRPDSLRLSPGVPVSFRLVPAPLTLAAITVTAGPAIARVSSRELRDVDLALRPRDSSQELLRLAPGLVIAQHAGGGKAEQIFLRGFDADHGTDVAISVDGTPVNLVSHAHGQGYADLHFLLPEVVEAIDVRKGPFDVRDGNLATAGAVAFTTRDRLGQGSAEVRGGSFGAGSSRLLVPFGGEAGKFGGYLAGAFARSDGPFLAPQDYRRGNLFGKLTTPLGSGVELVASASAFDSRWDASGQLPSRAIQRGLVSRFGSLDPSEGGTTGRVEGAIALRSRNPLSRWQLRAYGVGYRFELFSNFTFFLNDSINGDGIVQRDRRAIVGAEATLDRSSAVLGAQGDIRLLAGVRHDDSDVRLSEQTNRAFRRDRLASGIEETHLFIGSQQSLRLGPRLRIGLGVRADLIRATVADRSPRPSSGPSGSRTEGVLSPKLDLSWYSGRGITFFANAGRGFHSNDARDVVLAGRGASVLPRATGAELGARRTWERGTIAVAAWAIDLQSELVFVGDEGVTEASGRTRRLGVDLEGRVQLTGWLWADADINLARGRFRDEPVGGNRIPLAPTLTATAGLTIRDAGPFGAAMRVRHIDSRPADEQGEIIALGYTVTDVSAQYRFGRVSLVAAVENMFNVTWNEAQFATTSRLATEVLPVTELNFTPGARRSVQLGARVGL